LLGFELGDSFSESETYVVVHSRAKTKSKGKLCELLSGQGEARCGGLDGKDDVQRERRRECESTS